MISITTIVHVYLLVNLQFNARYPPANRKDYILRICRVKPKQRITLVVRFEELYKAFSLFLIPMEKWKCNTQEAQSLRNLFTKAQMR